MKTLLTGSTGFVGAYLRTLFKCVPLEDSQGAIDLRDAQRVGKAITEIRPDRVIHLAAQSFVPESFRAPMETFDVNFIGTFNLLNALKAVNFTGRMLYVGSGDMYGRVSETALPIMEETPLRPRSPYAVSKVAAEALCYQWSQTENFEILMARPFNHIGPGQGLQFVVPVLASQLAMIAKGLRKPILEVGDVDVTRDFSDARDIVRAYRAILQGGRNGEAYNVCSGRETSIREILERLVEISGLSVSIQPNGDRFRPSEQRRMVGSFKKLHIETGWEPEITLEKSLSDIYNYSCEGLK